MKIFATLLVLACWLTFSTAEYRYKVRGPPPPPRQPPVSHQYAKKWSHAPRGPPAPVRGRPIPVHMPPNYKIPMGASPGTRPIAPPVRNFWKNTQSNTNHVIRTKPEKKKQKPFLSSPPIGITNKEYDYHVQTNAIPMHTNTIKQVGEKGPIHTIPAPNLSLADKPAVVEEVRVEQQQQQQLLQVRPSELQLHQYQVTESNEPSLNIFRAQQAFYHDLSGLEAQTSVRKAEAAAVQSQKQASAFGQLIQQPKSEVIFKSQDPQLPTNDVYQFLNYYPQQTVDSFKFPPIQQQFLQQNYQQAQQLPSEPSNAKSEASFYEQLEQIRQQNSNVQEVQPEYHSFNYEEQSQKGDDRSGSVDLSSMVTADYSLEPAADSSEILHSTIARNPSDVLAQSQYIQQYFDTRDENASDNNVEPDAKTVENRNSPQQTDADDGSDESRSESDALASAFYATLPNRQAAEALASLQAAGKINNDKVSRQQNPVTVYISESSTSTENNTNNKKQYDNEEEIKEVEYDDYPSEEPAPKTKGDKTDEQEAPMREETSVSFGSRIKPKRNK